MDKFLEAHNLIKLNQEETEYLNRAELSKDIELMIKNPPTKKSPGPEYFLSEF